jgi:hypothetical protein
MLSLLAITADSNACRHPTNEIINPVAPIGFPAAPRSAPDRDHSAIYVSILIASNSQ